LLPTSFNSNSPYFSDKTSFAFSEATVGRTFNSLFPEDVSTERPFSSLNVYYTT